MIGHIDHFFILNQRGSPVLVRSFLVEPSVEIAETFYSLVTAEEKPPPYFSFDGIHYVYHFSNDLFLAFAAHDELSPNLLIEVLSRIPVLVTDYMGKFTENSILRNLALVTEIVDEVISFGCPQSTDSTHLLHLVHNSVPYDTDSGYTRENVEGAKESVYDKPLAIDISKRGAMANEIYIKLEETINATISPDRVISSALVSGTCHIKQFVTGQPYVSLQINPASSFKSRGHRDSPFSFDDIIFSPIVNSKSFDADRTMTCQPPTGDVFMFTYRTSRVDNLPITMSHVFENKQAKVVVVRVSFQNNLGTEKNIKDFVAYFQCPVEISNAMCELANSVINNQEQGFDRETRQIWWKIRNFPGKTEFSARFRFIFDDGITAAAETILGPVMVKFRIPDWNESGMCITTMNINNGGGDAPSRWLKVATYAGDYVFTLI